MVTLSGYQALRRAGPVPAVGLAAVQAAVSAPVEGQESVLVKVPALGVANLVERYIGLEEASSLQSLSIE
jgi:hypothetical protein